MQSVEESLLCYNACLIAYRRLPCLGCSYLEEVLGHPAMASLGRMRRRMAATSMLQLINGHFSPVLLDLKLFSQVMAVAMRTLREAPQFEVSYLASRKMQ